MFWHIKSFQDYIKEDINPLGLRVQIFPNLESLDSDFKIAWEQILCTCSKDMMQLLIVEYEKRSRTLDVDIEGTCLRLQTFKTHKSFMDREIKLKKHLEVYNRDILTKKDGKFSKDRSAFEENRAYKWSGDQQYKKNRGFGKRKDHYSAISNSSSSLSSVYSQVPPKNKKAPGPNHPQGQKTNTDNAPGCSSSTALVTGRVTVVVTFFTITGSLWQFSSSHEIESHTGDG